MAGNPANEQLIEAALNCDPIRIESALKSGADPMFRPSSDFTPLIYVAMKCRVGIDPIASAKLLLHAGTDINYRGSGFYSALSFAAEGPCLQLVRLLLENGADVSVGPGTDNPLVLTSDLQIIELLLSYGANPNAICHSKMSAVQHNEALINDLCQLAELTETERGHLIHFRRISAMLLSFNKRADS